MPDFQIQFCDKLTLHSTPTNLAYFYMRSLQVAKNKSPTNIFRHNRICVSHVSMTILLLLFNKKLLSFSGNSSSNCMEYGLCAREVQSPGTYQAKDLPQARRSPSWSTRSIITPYPPAAQYIASWQGRVSAAGGMKRGQGQAFSGCPPSARVCASPVRAGWSTPINLSELIMSKCANLALGVSPHCAT